jgi:hypothetical protein
MTSSIVPIDPIALDIPPPQQLSTGGRGICRAIGSIELMGTTKGRRLWLTC